MFHRDGQFGLGEPASAELPANRSGEGKDGPFKTRSYNAEKPAADRSVSAINNGKTFMAFLARSSIRCTARQRAIAPAVPAGVANGVEKCCRKLQRRPRRPAPPMGSGMRMVVDPGGALTRERGESRAPRHASNV
jgi:hypothetical protein